MKPDLSKLRDRGTIKWTSLFLPEHVKSLRNYFANDGYTEQPILDEYEIEEMESRICYSMEAGEALEFGYWRDGFVSTVVGRVHYVDALTKELRIVSEDGWYGESISDPKKGSRLEWTPLEAR